MLGPIRSLLLLLSFCAAGHVGADVTLAKERESAPSAKATSEPVKVGELSCVVIRDGLVFPFKNAEFPRLWGDRLRLRCTVPVTLNQAPKDMVMTMTMEQDNGSSAPPIKASARQVLKASHLPSQGTETAEIELKVPSNVNECMGLALTVSVAGVKRTVSAGPADCDD
jgi:hypothetical protein